MRLSLRVRVPRPLSRWVPLRLEPLTFGAIRWDVGCVGGVRAAPALGDGDAGLSGSRAWLWHALVAGVVDGGRLRSLCCHADVGKDWRRLLRAPLQVCELGEGDFLTLYWTGGRSCRGTGGARTPTRLLQIPNQRL